MAKRSVESWVFRKISEGYTACELRRNVGKFSNKPKERVMREKKLTDAEYEKRFSFLAEVFAFLSGADK